MGTFLKKLNSSQLSHEKLLTLKEHSLSTARYQQAILPDTPVLIETVGSGLIAVTTLADRTYQLWHLSQHDHLEHFLQTITDHKPLAISLIIGDTCIEEDNHQLKAIGRLHFYPFYSEVQTALEQCYGRHKSRSCTNYLINPARHLTLHMREDQFIFESVAAYRLTFQAVVAQAALCNAPPNQRPRQQRRKSLKTECNDVPTPIFNRLLSSMAPLTAGSDASHATLPAAIDQGKPTNG